MFDVKGVTELADVMKELGLEVQEDILLQETLGDDYESDRVDRQSVTNR